MSPTSYQAAPPRDKWRGSVRLEARVSNLLCPSRYFLWRARASALMFARARLARRRALVFARARLARAFARTRFARGCARRFACARYGRRFELGLRLDEL